MKNWFFRSSGSPNGLVLGGGGARGCYQIGAWKAFRENGLQFERVAGTSIGALVGAMYVEGNLEQMIRFVETLKPTDIAADLFEFPETLGAWLKNRREIGSFLNRYIFSRQGMDISPLRQVLDDMFSYPRFAASRINFACMTFNLSRRAPEAYFKDEMTAANAQDIILASASCYPAFPVLKMNGSEYIDGGYWDNVPIDLAARMGARRIVAINVEGPGIVLPQNDSHLDVFEVKPLLPLGNFLDFSSAACVRSMQGGYLEISRALGAMCGFLFSFPKEDEADLAWMDGYLSFMFSISHVVISQKDLESTARWAAGFHDSDLSALLMKGRREGLLLESLAYLAGMDPYQEWRFEQFMQVLMKKLGRLLDQGTTLQDYLARAGRGELDRMTLIALMTGILLRNPMDQAKSDLMPLSALYPGETALAWTWYFLEEMYGNTENTADRSEKQE